MKNFKYVKKPVVVEAVKFYPAEATGIFVGSANPELPDWFNEGVKSGYLFHDSNGWRCRTMEGTSYTVDDGYWIIRGVKGELYPCAGDVFEQSYQQFTEEQAA